MMSLLLSEWVTDWVTCYSQLKIWKLFQCIITLALISDLQMIQTVEINYCEDYLSSSPPLHWTGPGV